MCFLLALLAELGQPSSVSRATAVTWASAVHQLRFLFFLLFFFSKFSFFKFIIFFSFSLTWDPTDAKLSKRYFSHSLGQIYNKLYYRGEYWQLHQNCMTL